MKTNPSRLYFKWFKTEFMKWMPKDLQCKTCNKQMKLQLLPDTYGN